MTVPSVLRTRPGSPAESTRSARLDLNLKRRRGDLEIAACHGRCPRREALNERRSYASAAAGSEDRGVARHHDERIDVRGPRPARCRNETRAGPPRSNSLVSRVWRSVSTSRGKIATVVGTVMTPFYIAGSVALQAAWWDEGLIGVTSKPARLGLPLGQGSVF